MAPSHALIDGHIVPVDISSTVGRSTAVQLDALRAQLGIGVDPWYDYSYMRAQKARKLGDGTGSDQEDFEAMVAKLKKSDQPKRRYMGVTEQLNSILKKQQKARDEQKKLVKATAPVKKSAPVVAVRKPKKLRRRLRLSAVFRSLGREDRIRDRQSVVPDDDRYTPNYAVCWPSMKVADFNERKPSETRRDRVKALEEERRSILVKAIEKREKAAEDPGPVEEEEEKTKRVRMYGYDDDEDEDERDDIYDDDDDDDIIQIEERRGRGGDPLSSIPRDAYILGGGSGSIRIPDFDKMLPRPDVVTRNVNEFIPAENADLASSTRVNPLANLIEFRKMPGGQKSSKPRKSLLRGEPVPLDPDAHRPRPKTGVTFADQLPRGAAVGRGEKSRHDAAMQALGVDSSLRRITTTYLSNLHREGIGHHDMSLQLGRSQRARQTDNPPDRPVDVVGTGADNTAEEPKTSEPTGITFGKQLSRSQAALGNRNTARDSQVASHAISTEMLPVEALDPQVMRPRLHPVVMDIHITLPEPSLFNPLRSGASPMDELALEIGLVTKAYNHSTTAIAEPGLGARNR